jgi:hypothetical protein
MRSLSVATFPSADIISATNSSNVYFAQDGSNCLKCAESGDCKRNATLSKLVPTSKLQISLSAVMSLLHPIPVPSHKHVLSPISRLCLQ